MHGPGSQPQVFRPLIGGGFSSGFWGPDTRDENGFDLGELMPDDGWTLGVDIGGSVSSGGRMIEAGAFLRN